MNYEEYMNLLKEKIEAVLAKGINPWQPPWDRADNGATGRAYNGMNALFLELVSEALFNNNPHYYTFDQAKALGCSVRKGEKAVPVIFFQTSFQRDKLGDDGQPMVDDEGRKIKEEVSIKPVFRTYSVFNATQLNPMPPAVNHQSEKLKDYDLEAANRIIGNSPVEIFYGTQPRAFYSLSNDRISMPSKDRFSKNEQSFYSTAFHEMAHSTMPESRLNRIKADAQCVFGSPEYAREELVAEISALTLCDRCGMKYTNESSAAYIKSWKDVISDKAFKLSDLYLDVSRATDYLQNPENRDRLHEVAVSNHKKSHKHGSGQARRKRH